MNKPVFLIAELSANHNQSLERAIKTVEAAAKAGADALKIQTYRADTITIDCDAPLFQIKTGLWSGRTLYDLYLEAAMNWEWTPKLQEVAQANGITLFSSPFDTTALDFLESLHCPIYKVASCELVDIPLLSRIAQTGKPVIVSTGMGSIEEIKEAVETLQSNGAGEITLLKCTTAYPAPPEEINLNTMVDMEQRFGVKVGLSDHTIGSAIPIAAVAMGATVIEKHFTLDKSAGGPDDSFSMEPDEFAAMVQDIRKVELALGGVDYSLTLKEKDSVRYRRSLFITQDMQAGDVLTPDNIRSIRPAAGAHTRNYKSILGKRVNQPLSKGTPFSIEMIDE